MSLPALSARAEEPAPLHVFAYNVAGHPFLYPKLFARTKALGEHLRTSDIDVIGLEEVWFHVVHNIVTKRSGYRGLYPDGHWAGSGLDLLTKLPVEEWSFHAFVPTVPPHRTFVGDADGLSRKGVLSVRLRTAHGPIDVHVTHLVADMPPEMHVPTRVAQIYELYTHIKNFSGDRPFILLADMNYDSGGVEALTAESLLGLKDVCLEAGHEACGPTFDERRIDYVYVHGPWKVVSANRRLDQPFPGIGRLSDHSAGVEARLVPLPGRPTVDLKKRKAALVTVVHQCRQEAANLAEQYKRRRLVPFFNIYMKYWTQGHAAHLEELAAKAENELRELSKERLLVRKGER